MSKFNQILLSLFILIALTPFLFYSLYLTVIFALFSVIIYLYVDYENSLTCRGPVDINALSRLVSCVKNFNFLQIIPRTLREYHITNPFSKAYYQSLDMPSVGPQQATRQAKANGGYVVSPNLVRSENRLFSPNLNITKHRPRYQITNGDSFYALSPIQSDSNNSVASSERFKNMCISDTGKQNVHSSMHSGGHNTSYTMNSSRTSIGSGKHSTTPASASRKAQSFTSPLLASTRYNLSNDSVLFADMNSNGFCSRLAQYSTAPSSASSGAATHQTQYTAPGQFPTVYLGKTVKLPVLSSRNSQKISKAPVRVRMAPLESEERRSYAVSDQRQILSDFSQTPPVPPKSVLDTLHEISRKRLHAQLGDYETETPKKQRTSEAAPNEAQKRDREDTQLEDDVRIKKRTRNNEISSSLSSSVVLDRPNKRKTTPVEEDTAPARSSKPTCKVAKKSVTSPNVLPISASVLLDQDEDEPMLVAVQSTPQPTSEEMAVKASEKTLSGGGQRVATESEPDHWLQRTLVPGSPMPLEQFRDFKQKMVKGRLLGMMNTIGKDDKDVDLFPSMSAQPASTSVLTPTTAMLPTMFTTASDSKTKKQVHFSDSLQIKTFDPAAHSTSLSETSQPQVTVEAATTLASGVATSSQPTLGFFSPVGGNNVATTTSTVTPISSAISSSQPLDNAASPFAQKTSAFSATFGQSATPPVTSYDGSGSVLPSISATPATSAPECSISAALTSTTLIPTFGTPTTSAPTFGDASSLGTFGSSTMSVPTFGASATTAPTLRAATTLDTTFGTPATSTTTFGPPATSATTFGAVTGLSTTFGTPATTATTFGTPATSATTFGAVTGLATTFSTPATTATTFGTPVTSATTFGAVTSLATTFGASTTSVPAFGASTTSIPTFGVSTTSAPMFGAATTSISTFGARTTMASTFGATTTSVPTFGASTTSVPTFGAATTSLSTFGTMPLTFTSPASGPSSGPTTSASIFGAITSPTTTTTAGPTFGSMVKTAPGFNVATTTSLFGASVPSFGSSSAAVTSSAGFGTTTTPSFGSAAPPPAYPGSKPQEGTVGKPFTFGSQTAGFGGSTFGGFASPAQPAFPAKPFSFSGAASGDGGAVFGNKPVQNANANPASPFQFNSGNAMSDSIGADGQPKSGGFKFDKPAMSTPFGMFSNSQPATTNTTTTPAQGGFSFNSTAVKPFGATAPNQTMQSSFDQNTFGSQNSIPQKSSVFGFGAAQPAASTFSFNAPNAAAKPTQATFGSASGGFGFQPAAPPAFGQAPQPSSGAFQFGAPAQTNSGGGFSFGAPSNNTQALGFGSATPNVPFQMAAPQFGGAMPMAPPGAGMFSIGTGSSSRGRLGARSRARR